MVQRRRGILMILLAVGDHGDHDVCRFNGLVVMISVLHTEGPGPQARDVQCQYKAGWDMTDSYP